jgi:hypothetical protein
MNFVKFTEINDHEGESWNFWLQLDGNKTQLKELESWLGTFDEYGESYKLDMEPVPEFEVDILVKHSDSGYMQYENKIKGKFICPTPGSEEEENGYRWLNDNFYKGDIKEYFKNV